MMMPTKPAIRSSATSLFTTNNASIDIFISYNSDKHTNRTCHTMGSVFIDRLNMQSLILGNDFGLMILIWLVQIIIYPSFTHISPDRFVRYHRTYTGQITFFVVPLMFAQLFFHALILWANPSTSSVVCMALIALAWLATFGLSVPCHHQLAKHGYSPKVINRLVRTNWIRTIAWTGVLIMDILPS